MTEPMPNPEVKYPTLDALAEEFKPGERVRAEVTGHSHICEILGYVYSLPLEAGGPDIPALVVRTSTGIGNVYPWEVTLRAKAGKADEVG